LCSQFFHNRLHLSSHAKLRSTTQRRYAHRLGELMEKTKEDPFSTLFHPFNSITALTPMSENEPDKQDRVYVGSDSDGRAIYMRNPIGKIGEEFSGCMNHPLDMLRNKLSTFARPVYQVVANDAGFGHKLYDPYAESTPDMLKNAGRIAWAFVGAQLPVDSVRYAKDALTGKGDQKVNWMRTLGPFVGVTFSQGAPGGPAEGEYYHVMDQVKFKQDEALPKIRRMIIDGNIDDAIDRMEELKFSESRISDILDTTETPSARLSKKKLSEFDRVATDAEQARMDRALER
jgi:hypothetical protein